MRKKPFKQLALLLIGLLLGLQAKAQEQMFPGATNVIPPSPEAANLGKYGSHPVSLNTGTPSISIPLYEIKGDNISLPITISYHAGGIKVKEVASWVGLGWVLNAGGVITRNVRGRPDEDNSHGYFRNISLYNTWKANGQWNSFNHTTGNPVYDFKIGVALGDEDIEPDEYLFNFGGYSGRIFHNENRKAIIFPYQDFKIERRNEGTVGSDTWIITSPEGTKYTFNDIETSGGPGTYHSSSWFLSSIASADGKEIISFSYTKSLAEWKEPIYQIHSTVLSESINTSPGTTSCVSPPSSSFTPPDVMTFPLYLATIEYHKNGSKLMQVSLTSLYDRDDIESGNQQRRLTQIDIRRALGASQYDTIRSFEFDM